MSETTAAPEVAEQPNPYEIVRVSGPNGHESLRRIQIDGNDDYEVLDEPAVDGFGYPLRHKPRTDKAGKPSTRETAKAIAPSTTVKEK